MPNVQKKTELKHSNFDDIEDFVDKDNIDIAPLKWRNSSCINYKLGVASPFTRTPQHISWPLSSRPACRLLSWNRLS